MTGQVMHVFRLSRSVIWRSGAIFLMCLLIGSMINFLSPSVALSLDPDDRLEFWIILCLVGGAGILFCDLIVEYVMPELHLAIKSFAQSICGAVAVLIPLFVIYEPQELPGYNRTVLFVWVIITLILAGTFILKKVFEKPTHQARDENIEMPMNVRPKILSRLPVHLQDAELYALSAEDHYVRVHTSKGEDILLMRLSDSITEASNVEGAQTHRSWWVAKGAVAHVKSLGRTAEIKLKNDKVAPVSRNGLKTLKDLGWL